MLNIETLYGIEVIVSVPKPTDRVIKGLYTPAKFGSWIVATIVKIGIDCKKDIKVGDKVMITKPTYEESPILSSDQFNFESSEIPCTYHIMTEYMIAMKVSEILDVEFEEQ